VALGRPLGARPPGWATPDTVHVGYALEWLIRNRPELTLELLKQLSDHIVSMDSDGGRCGGGPGDL